MWVQWKQRDSLIFKSNTTYIDMIVYLHKSTAKKHLRQLTRTIRASAHNVHNTFFANLQFKISLVRCTYSSIIAHCECMWYRAILSFRRIPVHRNIAHAGSSIQCGVCEWVVRTGGPAISRLFTDLKRDSCVIRVSSQLFLDILSCEKLHAVLRGKWLFCYTLKVKLYTSRCSMH